MATISKKDILAALEEIKGNDVDMEQLATVIAGKVAAAGKPKEEPAPTETKEEKPADPPPARAASARGAAFDLLTAIAPKLGLTAEDALGDEAGYCNKLGERLWKIIDAAKLEQILESVAAGGAPPARTEKRAVAGLEDPAAQETWISAMLDLARKVLGKPEADPAAALTELQAVVEKLAAALSSAPPPPDGQPADQQAQQAQPTPAQRALDEEVTRCRTAFKKPEATPVELLAHARQATERAEHAVWLAKAITDRKLAVTEQDRAKLLDDCCTHGRAHVESYVAMLARPPSGVVMRSGIAPIVGAIESFADAVDACMDAAAKQLPANSPAHVVRAKAQKIARKEFPGLDEQAAS